MVVYVYSLFAYSELFGWFYKCVDLVVCVYREFICICLFVYIVNLFVFVCYIVIYLVVCVYSEFICICLCI